MTAVCLMCDCPMVDLAAHPTASKEAPSLPDMARYSVAMRMKGGPGYGEIRDMFMDTDPALVSCAGRIHQVDPDKNWLQEMKPWIEAAARRILDSTDEQGLYVCRRISGDAGSETWSSNASDVVGMGQLVRRTIS